MARKRTIVLGNTAFRFGILLEQYGIDNFAVRYGKQLDWPGLNYADAAAKLGEAFMHALACGGRIDNREKR